MEAFINTLTVVAGVALSLAYYPQAYQIWKAKSAENVSLLTFVIFSFGTTIWLIYGFYHMDLVVISGFLLGVIGSWLVLILKIYYTRAEKRALSPSHGNGLAKRRNALRIRTTEQEGR